MVDGHADAHNCASMQLRLHASSGHVVTRSQQTYNYSYVRPMDSMARLVAYITPKEAHWVQEKPVW